MSKLNQVVAVEKGIKSQTTSKLSVLYKTIQKSDLFEGLTRTYAPLQDDGEQFPNESVRVQKSANAMVNEVGNVLTELFDVTATKDATNCRAKADVKVDDKALLQNVPLTTLLFLEKQLVDIYTFVSKLPTLEGAYNWNFDANDGLLKTDSIVTVKTKKVVKALVLYDATDHHPAQTDKITEDVTVGHWTQVKLSGKMPEARKSELLHRVEKLQKAVKFAREEANSTEVEHRKLGEKLFSWLFE